VVVLLIMMMGITGTVDDYDDDVDGVRLRL
jgi:hypothetical protein